jgi:beta-barrel assembly-enhancing protease
LETFWQQGEWHHASRAFNASSEPHARRPTQTVLLAESSALIPSILQRRALQRLISAVCASALLGVSITPLARAQVNLPALGDTASDDFNLGAERKLGDQIMREIRRDPDYLDDPVLLEYLQSLWQPLLAAARQRGEITAEVDQRFAWEPFLVRDRSVNAFALPGGYIGVHLGLMAMTATRDELASVLAHEMSHVTQRHIARSIANSKKQSLLSAAALILGVLAASRSRSTDAANAVITGSQAAAIQGQLNFSRDMEREADRVGFSVMTGAGFSAGGMAAMFEKLDASSRFNDNGGFPYLRSHPLTVERIGEARARAGVSLMAAPPSGLEHSLAQARARVLMDTRVDALRRWQALDAQFQSATDADVSTLPLPEKLANAASSALASTLLRDWPRADKSLLRAQTLKQFNPRPDARAERALALLNAQSQLERGNSARAVEVLEPYAQEVYGAQITRPMLLMNARVALSAGLPPAVNLPRLTRSAEALQTWVAVNRQDAEAWSSLSQIWGALNQPLRALRADAEARYLLGDWVGAIDRLKAGQRLARRGSASAAGADFIEASVIDSRLRDIEAQRKALSAEEQRAG